jgi:hypothetical protein
MNWTTNLPPPLAKALKAETSGDPVLYAVQPQPWPTFRATLPIWLMGIPWTALTMALLVMALAGPLSGTPPPPSLGPGDTFGLMMVAVFISMFVLAGWGMMLAPFWAYWKAKHTVYAVTKSRLIILTLGRSLNVQSIEPDGMRGFTRLERRDGSGTLTILQGFGKDSDGDPAEKTETLWCVPTVKHLEGRLHELRRRNKMDAASFN